jgi:hypothetical protein
MWLSAVGHCRLYQAARSRFICWTEPLIKQESLGLGGVVVVTAVPAMNGSTSLHLTMMLRRLDRRVRQDLSFFMSSDVMPGDAEAAESQVLEPRMISTVPV